MLLPSPSGVAYACGLGIYTMLLPSPSGVAYACGLGIYTMLLPSPSGVAYACGLGIYTMLLPQWSGLYLWSRYIYNAASPVEWLIPVLLLSPSGVVYTCGLNDAHQLGHGSNPTTAPQNALAPKPVSSYYAYMYRGIQTHYLTALME